GEYHPVSSPVLSEATLSVRVLTDQKSLLLFELEPRHSYKAYAKIYRAAENHNVFNSKQESTGQLRSTLSRARELCERWRSGGGATPAPPAPPPDDEGGGRLARWFSVRRGSSHQYDMHGHESDKMPKLP
ncbi:hypothetical protein SFRURICE_014254, partial [Spodoptera frugiperda]